MKIVVDAHWDEQAKVWVAVARGDIGLVTEATTVEELERNLKLTDGILRYLTVRTEENAITNPNPAAVRAHTEQARHGIEESSAKTEPTT